MGTLYPYSDGQPQESRVRDTTETCPAAMADGQASLSFGCHLTWPELRSVAVLDRKTLSRERDILAKEEWDFQDRPTYYTAIRNLQGFIAFHLNEDNEALEKFMEVLAKDPANINALGNLAHIQEGLFQMKEARRFRDRLEGLIQGPSYEERARAYADRAHAIRYFEQSKRCFRYMRYVERAATIGKKCSSPHAAEWSFDYALALYRRDVQMLYLRNLASAEMDDPSPTPPPPRSECYSEERIQKGFIKTSRIFLDVIRTSTCRDYRALSWVFLGILVNHDPERRSLDQAFPDNEDVRRLSAAECYANGLDVHGDHPIVARRVGSEYVKLGLFSEAKALLDKSLAACRSQFGHRHRALMHLAMYERADEERGRTDEARGWLLEAARDFEQALLLKEFHADYSDLGHVYFLLGETDKALWKFEQATRSKQEDYFDPVLTRRRWARCLKAKGQLEGYRLLLEQARDVRLKLLETPLDEDEQGDYFSDDFDHYSTEERPGFVRILRDYHFWSASSNRRASELSPPEERADARASRYRYDFLVWHAERDARWAVALVHKLESQHGLTGCIPRRDFVPGSSKHQDILRCLGESHRCLLVLTPSRPGAGVGRAAEEGTEWDSLFVDHAAFETSRRRGDFVVPVKLRRCPVPDVFRTVTALECEEGQIPSDHWQKLLDTLSQNSRR